VQVDNERMPYFLTW